MRYPSLESPRAKLAWAAKHSEILDREGRAWEQSHPYRIRGRFDREAREYVGGLTVEPRPSPDLRLLVGDYVHSLRSALDHLVWQLVIANGEVPGRDNQFPIARTEPEWERAVERGQLRGVEAEAVAIIRDSQPFAGPGPADRHLLSALNALDVSDKHHVLTTGALGIPFPDVQQGRMWGMTVQGNGNMSSISVPLPLPVVEDNADFIRVKFSWISSDFEMELMDELAGIELRFGVESGNLTEFSVSLSELVRNIVDKFEPGKGQPVA